MSDQVTLDTLKDALDWSANEIERLRGLLLLCTSHTGSTAANPDDAPEIIRLRFEGREKGITALEVSQSRLLFWVNDLQSGMYVNCVYCGHCYGPKETTPVSMADALKAHVEECPKHPMSALKTRVKELERHLKNAVLSMEGHPKYQGTAIWDAIDSALETDK